MPSSSETIIGIDLGTKCGFAVLQGRKRVESGRWNLRSSRKGWHRGERWIDFEVKLRMLQTTHQAEVIAYERVRRHVGTTAAHVYGGLLAMLERFDFGQRDYDYRAELVPIEVGSWKKATTGNGAALKPDVGRFVRKRFRYTAASEDEADALAIAEACRRMRRGEYP